MMPPETILGVDVHGTPIFEMLAQKHEQFMASLYDKWANTHTVVYTPLKRKRGYGQRRRIVVVIKNRNRWAYQKELKE